jgi:hypothetical protein
MTKKWVRKDGNFFEFSVNDQETGSLQINTSSMKQRAVAKIKGHEFIIQRTGFWKNKIEITDENGNTVARVFNEKWYSRSSILEYKSTTFNLLLRNNPLAEWVVLDGAQEVMSYKLLSQKGADMKNIQLADARQNPDYLLDHLLWYLFVPIAHEYSNGDSSFIAIIAAS